MLILVKDAEDLCWGRAKVGREEERFENGSGCGWSERCWTDNSNACISLSAHCGPGAFHDVSQRQASLT